VQVERLNMEIAAFKALTSTKVSRSSAPRVSSDVIEASRRVPNSSGRSVPGCLEAGSVVAELLEELGILTKTNLSSSGISVDLLTQESDNSEDLYIPDAKFNLEQLRKLWFDAGCDFPNLEHGDAPVAVISNLSPDHSSSGKHLMHMNLDGVGITIGRHSSLVETRPTLELDDDSVLLQHCTIEYVSTNENLAGKYVRGDDCDACDKGCRHLSIKTPQAYVTPHHVDSSKHQEVAEVYINGARIFETKPMYHGDRIVIGGCAFVGVFVECPQINRSKLMQRHVESSEQHRSHRKNSNEDIDEAMEISELKINRISYAEALHEVFRASVAKTTLLSRTLSMVAPSQNRFNSSSQSMSTISSTSSEDDFPIDPDACTQVGNAYAEMEQRAMEAEKRLEEQRMNLYVVLYVPIHMVIS
jgi:pSer/pThr/pTyr-binding forkhead associated (FHA) protein